MKKIVAVMVLAAALTGATTHEVAEGGELRLGGAIIKVVNAEEDSCVFTYYSPGETESFILGEGEFSNGILLLEASPESCVVTESAGAEDYLTKGEAEKKRSSPFLWALAGLGILALLAYYGKRK
jgi:hypothetical protein